MGKTITKTVKTNNMTASQKLQNAGIKVFAITGGHLLQVKEHYFHIGVPKGLDLKEGELAIPLILRELKNQKGELVLDENEINDFVEVEEVGKTTFPPAAEQLKKDLTDKK